MHHCANRAFVDAETERHGPNQNVDLIRHPALLILLSLRVVHFGVIANRRDSVFAQSRDGRAHAFDRW